MPQKITPNLWFDGNAEEAAGSTSTSSRTGDPQYRPLPGELAGPRPAPS